MYTLNKKEIKTLLEEHGASMKYGLGQNYLTSTRSIKAFINNFADTPQIIEIGPGIGNITINYFDKFKKVLLIELDEEKIPILRNVLTIHNKGTFPSWVEIVNANILDIDILDYIDPSQPYQIVGALPYNISKRIVRKITGILPPPQDAVFIVQKEVADKYTETKPNTTFLSISAECLATVKKKEILRKNEFFPVPKVDSRIITLSGFTYKTQRDLSEAEELISFIKKGFSAPRKKLSNTFGKLSFSKVAEALLQKRPQELDLSEWKRLYNSQK